MAAELTLLVDPSYKEALLRHPLLSEAAAKPRETALSDTWFDTPDLRLRHSNADLLVRRHDHGFVQHMNKHLPGNGGGGTSGLHTHEAWESPVPGPEPDLGLLRKVAGAKKRVPGAALAKRLAPVFTAKLKRTAWDVQLHDGEHIACALDQGRLECGAKKLPISELELELTSGDPAQLFDVALALQRDIPLHIGNRSRADRGYALLAPQAPSAVKATALALSPGMTVEQAFQEIAFNCLAHMQGNDESVANGRDVESLHQMRVGMRRLRSALNMYKNLLHLPDELQQELDWLATELADARDWDVLAGSTLPALAKELPDPARIDAVQQAATEQAQQHHVTAGAAVGSARYTRLMLGLARWVQAMGWHDDQAAMAAAGKRLGEPVTKFARATLERDQRRLRTRARNLRAATPEARHRVRIAAKKTRYAAEFFGSLFAAKRVRPYVQALTAMQDELGFLNDAAVAERLLGEVSNAQPELAPGAAFIQGFLAAKVKNDDRKIVRLWEKFEQVGLPR